MRSNLSLILTFLSLVLPALVFADTPIVTHTTTVSVTPVVDTNAYTAGDAVGGKMTFANVVREQVYSGEIRSVVISDLGGDVADLTLILFSSDPSTTTITNNAALDIADVDLPKVICAIPLTTHTALADNSVTVAMYVGCAFQLDNSRTIYGALRATGTPTLDAADALTVKLTVRQD